ncbi:MAG: hypothetical protein ACRYF0_17480 [Janthinobacterium lividum]
MESKKLRIRAVRQVLAHPASRATSCQELELFTQYVLGQRSREELGNKLALGNRLALLA